MKNPPWPTKFKTNPKFCSQRGEAAFSSGCFSVDYRTGMLTHRRAEGSPYSVAAGRRTGISCSHVRADPLFRALLMRGWSSRHHHDMYMWCSMMVREVGLS